MNRLPPNSLALRFARFKGFQIANGLITSLSSKSFSSPPLFFRQYQANLTTEVVVNLSTQLRVGNTVHDVVVFANQIPLVYPEFIFRENVLRGQKDVVVEYPGEFICLACPRFRFIIEVDSWNGDVFEQSRINVFLSKILREL